MVEFSMNPREGEYSLELLSFSEKFFLFHFCSIFCVHIIELECFVDFRYHYVMRTCNEIRNNILSLNSYFRFVLIEFCSDVSYLRFLNL